MKNSLPIKQAMIMAAGLGTRLKPLTDSTPKALVKYRGKPLIDYILNSLSQAGFQRIVINVHHFGDQIINFIQNYNPKDTEVIISDERNKLLDTGGGIRKAAAYFADSPVLIHNVDILTNADLRKYIESFEASPSLASLLVKKRDTSRSLIFDDDMNLCGWKHNKTGEKIISRKISKGIQLAFSGVYIISSDFIDLLPNKDTFSVMPEILRMAKDYDIKGYRHDGDKWKDMGKLEEY